MRTRTRLLFGLVAAVLALSSFNLGIRYQQAVAMRGGPARGASLITGLTLPRLAGSSAARNAADVSESQVFDEVWGAVKKQYVEDLDSREAERKLAYGAARGLLASLEDPYTRFLDPQEYDEFQKETEGHFNGIGATITMLRVPMEPEESKRFAGTICPVCGSHFTPEMWRVGIQAPLLGSPAAKAGLRPGDFILAVDGVSTEGVDLYAAVKMIRGPAGKTVHLKIGRHGGAGPMDISIVRAVITAPNVEAKIPERPAGVGVVAIRTFNETSADAVASALERIRKAKARALVLDLRNCAGGLLKSAIEVARQFVPTGPVLQVQERNEPRKPQPANPRRPGPGFDLPIAVLVNGGTASAAEILAGAIQDEKKGILVGERTFGKGLVQTVIPLSDGSAVAITTAKYFTPRGRDINRTAKHEGGIVPDQMVTVPKDVLLENVRLTDRDPQYARALQLLTSKGEAHAAARSGDPKAAPAVRPATAPGH